jgi:small subunit ribosomal protein S16
MTGAQPTDTVRAIFSYRGVMYKKHLQVGVNKGAITQEVADQKYEDWKATKESKISGRVDDLAKAKADANKARLEAEAKVNEARLASQAAKLAAEIAAANPAPAEEVAEVAAEATPEGTESETTANE